MKIKNLAFFGIMAAILGVNGAARADSTTIIASQAYVDAKDALKQNNLGGGTNAGKVVEATATAGTVNYRGIDTTPTASSTNLITSGGVQAAIAAVDLSSAVSQTITEGVTDKAPSEDAVYNAIVAEDGEYIEAGTAVGANLKALDDQVKANTSDIGTNTTNIGINTTNIGTINTTIGDTAMGTTATTLTGAIAELKTGKQDSLTFDDSPTSGSDNPVKSGGVYTALSGKQDTLTFDNSPTSGSDNPVKSGGVYTAVDAKQNKLGGTGNGDKAVIAGETEGTVTYKAIDTQVTADSDHLITSGAVSTAIGNASTAVNSAYDNNALNTAGLAAADNLAKMKAVQATIARQGTFNKAWSEEFNSTDIGNSGATNLYAASKNSNEGSDMDNYVPTVKAVEKRLNGATTADFEKLHAVSATASEINALHSSGVTTADLTKLHDVTADASELNILDGVTADASELNILDGATLTTTELNYVDGVTSNIQTQLDAKQDTLTFDSTPTSASANPVTSGGVYTALAGKQASFNDGSQTGTGLVKTVSQSGGTVSASASLGIYVSDMNNALKDVSSNSTATCTKGSPCTLTYYKDGTNEYMRWTPMDTENTNADTTAADSSNV